jgi:tRNA dimethylallyltransferase
MDSNSIDKPVLFLLGATAIGKTNLSLQIASRYNCEIISVDSMQVYKYMDIGTAKILEEERAEIVHHLIDIIEPDKNYDAVQFTQDALTAIRKIHLKEKVPLLTGGTGLYYKALIDGIFPGIASDNVIRKQLIDRLKNEGPDVLHDELKVCDCISASKIHKNDTHRLLRALEIYYLTGKPWSLFLEAEENTTGHVKLTNTLEIGLQCSRDILYERINLRTRQMIGDGLEEEVRGLLNMGYGRDLKSMGSIGYRHMIKFIFKEWSYEEMERLLARDTRRYAKRQGTWFSKMKNIHWIEGNDTKSSKELIENWLKRTNSN